MTPERWRQIERVLHAALEREPAKRAEFLDCECAGDSALREEVESLLASSQHSDSSSGQTPQEDATVLLEGADEYASMVGRNVGPYSLRKLIGSGGMGEVYLAQDARLDRKVALKLLSPGLLGDSEPRTRFLREARLASALDHPNICTIHEVGEDRGRPFIAMQYIKGQTLRQIINGRPLKVDSLLSISLQVADALAAAHEEGVIHRDIKPGNIIVTPRGQAKVLDFGLAKLVERNKGEAETHLTVTGAVMGTPASMSPEQARGERVDHRSDIFSFGVVLYEMATGQIPFKGRSPVDIISAVLKDPPTPAAELNKDVPARLSWVIDHALEKEPAERYQSMREMIADLRQVVAEAGGLDHLFKSSDMPRGVPFAPPRSQSPIRVFGRKFPRRAVIAFLCVMALAVAGLAFAIYQSRPQQAPTSTQNELERPQAATSIRSMAVLPFKPLVPSSRDESLEMGMADTLIHRLSNIRQLTVRPLSAVRQYARLEQDAVAAGREQKVDAVLDGNIQRAGEKIRVTVRLVRVADGGEMWSEQFDENLKDIFALQDSVSEKVARQLAVTLTVEERELLTKRHTGDVEAYRLYMSARYHLNRLTDDGFRKALDYFQGAVERDPDYALAHAGLADAFNALGGFNALPPKESFPKAKQAALKALELDEHLAEAHISLANVEFFYYWNPLGAEDNFQSALKINPSSSDSHQMYGFYLAARGRFDEALGEMQRAQELEPVSIVGITGMGEVFHLARRHDEAIAVFRKALEMDPNFGFAYWGLGRAYTEKGMYDEAIVAFQKAIPLSGDSPDEPADLARAYARSGRQAKARVIIGELKEQSKKRYVGSTTFASIYGALGEKDEAFVWLEKAYQARSDTLLYLMVDPMYDNLRSDPRFSDLVRRLNLR